MTTDLENNIKYIIKYFITDNVYYNIFKRGFYKWLLSEAE